MKKKVVHKQVMWLELYSICQKGSKTFTTKYWEEVTCKRCLKKKK